MRSTGVWLPAKNAGRAREWYPKHTTPANNLPCGLANDSTKWTLPTDLTGGTFRESFAILKSCK